MKKYILLSENDIVPNNRYRAIVYYPYPSPNRNPMVDSVFYDKYRAWSGTDKDIAKIVDESIISVLFEYNPERACEIIEGGFIEDGRFNDILSSYDFKLQEKYKEYYMDKAERGGINMADREIVVRIPEDKYNRLIQQMKLDRNFSECEITELGEHGRLGDLDALEEEMTGGINAGLMIDGYENYSHINDIEDCLECVKYADTIIEAHHPVPVKEKHKNRDDDWER